MMCNMVTNAKVAPFNFGVRVAGVDSPTLLSVPAGSTGQFDSGNLNPDDQISFGSVDQFSTYYSMTAGGFGVLQVERIITLLEVDSFP